MYILIFILVGILMVGAGGFVWMNTWERRAMNSAIEWARAYQSGEAQPGVAFPKGRIYLRGSTVSPFEHWGQVEVRVGIQSPGGEDWKATTQWNALTAKPTLLDFQISQLSHE